MIQRSQFAFCPYDGDKLDVDRDARHPSCRTCGFIDYQNPRPCVAIFIVQDDRVLLARRGVEPAKGEWDIPGGFVNPGESAEQAVLREAQEETTLDVRVHKYLGSISDVYGIRRTPTLNLCFLVKVDGGTPKPRSDVESLEWFALVDPLPRLAFTHQKGAIDMLKIALKP